MRVEKLAHNKRRRWHPLAPWCVGIIAATVLGLGAALSFEVPGPAPALLDDPVYMNKQEGFRFLRPEGWHMHARGEFPSGLPADTERLLVGYQRLKSEHPATLDVTMLDMPAEGSLVDAMARPGVAGHEWHSTGRFQLFKVSDLEAARAAFEGLERRPKDDQGNAGRATWRACVLLYYRLRYVGQQGTRRGPKALDTLSW